MELENKPHLTVKKENHLFQLICDKDCPLGLLFDALMEMKGWCVERMTASHAQECKQAEEKMEKEEEKKEEVEDGSSS